MPQREFSQRQRTFKVDYRGIEALTAISCAKADADVRLSFFPLRCRDNLRVVAVESAHRLGISSLRNDAER